MIVKCQGLRDAIGSPCSHEWQTARNDKPCDWCGGPGKSIGDDYMSDADGSICYEPINDEDAEVDLAELIGTPDTMPVRVR